MEKGQVGSGGIAGALPPSGQNERLDRLVRILEGKSQIDWWVRIAPFAAILVGSALGLIVWGLQQQWTKNEATATLANANASAIIQVKESLLSLRAEMKEGQATVRTDLSNTEKRMDAGKVDREANQRIQAEQIGSLREGQARFDEALKNQTSLIERLLRKVEEARRDSNAPFEENKIENPLRFLFIQRAADREHRLP